MYSAFTELAFLTIAFLDLLWPDFFDENRGKRFQVDVLFLVGAVVLVVSSGWLKV